MHWAYIVLIVAGGYIVVAAAFFFFLVGIDGTRHTKIKDRHYAMSMFWLAMIIFGIIRVIKLAASKDSPE